MKKDSTNWIWFAWLVSAVAMAGSLYVSLVAHWEPCVLCWYQRIGMYPLVAILLVGAVIKDKNVTKYAWPLVIVGGLISLYHNLLRWGVLPETCSATGPSCLQGVAWFGFITLPMLALTAFVLIGLSLWQAGRK